MNIKNKKIKVAHVCTTRLSYKILEDKLVLLREKGYEIDIVADETGVQSDIFKKNDITEYTLAMKRNISPIHDIKSIINMMKLLKKNKYDIIHTHTAKAGIIGRIAGRLAKTPVVIYTAHGLPFFEDQNPIKYHIFKSIEIIGAKIGHYFGSQNEEDLKYMQRYIQKEKTFYEGNGIDTQNLTNIAMQAGDIELNDLRKGLNIPAENVILLMGARFESVKNHTLLLEALSKLKLDNINNFTCLLAGKGELESEVRSKVSEMNLEKNVRFLGHKTNIYPYIQLADIVVLSSLKEGIPRILMESMYYAKPVVATRVLGTRELVVDKKTGLLSELGSSEEMANNLEKLISSDSLRKQMGENGKSVVEAKYTEQKVVERIDNFYQFALKEKGVL
ncbi:MAG: glycosyltransferase family 4 protein [Culicoidibacterales bacterium]